MTRYSGGKYFEAGMTDRDVQAHFDQLADRYDELSHWNSAAIKHHVQRTMGAILDHVNLTPDSRVLDFGCGTGFYTRLVAVHMKNTVGVDMSIEMLRRGRIGRNSVNLIRALGQSLPFKDQSFDIAISISTFEHVLEVVPVLREIMRVVKAGGRVLTVVPNRKNNWVEIQRLFRIGDDDQLSMEWRRTEKEMQTYYRAAGLKDIRSNSFLFVPGLLPDILLHPARQIERILEFSSFARRYAGTIAISGCA